MTWRERVERGVCFAVVWTLLWVVYGWLLATFPRLMTGWQ